MYVSGNWLSRAGRAGAESGYEVTGFIRIHGRWARQCEGFEVPPQRPPRAISARRHLVLSMGGSQEKWNCKCLNKLWKLPASGLEIAESGRCAC